MKKGFIVGLVCFVAVFIMLAFNYRGNEIPMNVQDAVKTGLLDATYKSNGKYSGLSVSVTLNNKSASPQRIRIPAGSVYHPKDPGEQSLLQLEDTDVLVDAKASRVVQVAAFCSEADDRSPQSEGSFTIAETGNIRFKDFITYLKNKDIDKSVFQEAVWVLSDNHQISNIDASVKGASELRSYLATKTGQKETWYSTPRNVHSDEQGNLRFETVRVSGELAFACKKGEKIYQDICKSDGTVVHDGTKYFTPTMEKVRYNFNIAVTGWEKGSYYVSINDGQRVLARFDFSI